jgi:hypothetical protein
MIVETAAEISVSSNQFLAIRRKKGPVEIKRKGHYIHSQHHKSHICWYLLHYIAL